MAGNSRSGGATAETFQSMGIGESMLQSLSEYGFKNPTEVQIACVKKITEGESLYVKADSGSGKSAAVAIAAVAMVNTSDPRIQVIKLSARLKLAVELEKAIQQLGRHKNVRAHAMSARSPLMQETQILIGVPNFVFEKMRSRTVDVSSAHVILVDDCEEMERMSGKINEVISFTSENINQLCFLGSAIPSGLLKPAIVFDIGIEEIAVDVLKHKHIEHYQVDVKNDVDKMKHLHQLLESNANAIIFCNSKGRVKYVCDALKLDSDDVRSIDGELLPRKRDILVDQLRSGDFKYLVTTDIKSSKLRASLVVMYDIPTCLEVYKDRADRVCRGGSAFSLVKPSDESLMKRIKKGN